MRVKRHTGQVNDTEIDMTPMLDIVFIMLIFFIVTTSFIKEAGVDVKRPDASTAQRQEASSIYVAITPDGEIWIDRQMVDLRALRTQVERLRLENPEAAAVVQADTDARHGLVVKVMDQLRLGGVETISVAATQN
ncbi:biopolymer transport protein ExbD/TolR [Oceanococcus atlanticus]|uniref:Biopolymer transport protein ExbD/TolR n=1 Tax=Oceanococcus atlanticus TaxID=1317117 RepID=A0A1Y1SGB7_9GAMM|nr:biopolymer transporter ExbD [Oceanococcus atlanticus]ORE88693.1 biopolymer transport protein ExbD/TolR [Oceanococcus atlanticus]RZO84242.1 MAG: biopolymer transporter ExbD [Oceanococcus sp.]